MATVGAVAVAGAALFSSLAVSGASMAATTTTQDVTYVASAIDTSAFASQGGAFTVTYTPATTLDEACGVTPQPFKVDYSVTAPAATSAWASAPTLTYGAPQTSVNHTTAGVDSLQVTWNVSQAGTLRDNTGWSSTAYPTSASPLRTPSTEFAPTGAYVRPTATAAGKIVPTIAYDITGGAIPSSDPAGVALDNNTWNLAWGQNNTVEGPPEKITGQANPVNAVNGVVTDPWDGAIGRNNAGGSTLNVLGSLATSTREGATVPASHLLATSPTDSLFFADVTGTATCAEVVDTPVVDGGVAAAAAGVVGIAGLGGVMISRRRKAAESL